MQRVLTPAARGVRSASTGFGMRTAWGLGPRLALSPNHLVAEQVRRVRRDGGVRASRRVRARMHDVDVAAVLACGTSQRVDGGPPPHTDDDWSSAVQHVLAQRPHVPAARTT